MLVLVAYDVNVQTDEGKKRLRRIAKICESRGQRVQNSVFECLVDPAMWAGFKARLEKAINPSEDSLRYYYLGKNWRRRVEHFGAKPSYDPEGPLIF